MKFYCTVLCGYVNRGHTNYTNKLQLFHFTSRFCVRKMTFIAELNVITANLNFVGSDKFTNKIEYFDAFVNNTNAAPDLYFSFEFV